MKNILFVITKSQNGGAQKWTKEQIEFCSNNFRCFLSTDENGWLSQNVQVENSFLCSLIHKRFSFSYLLQLNEFIKENNIHLIVASSANAGIYSRLIKIFNKKVKIIYVSHGWSSIYNGGKLTFLYTFIERQLSKISDSILCISKKDLENARDVINIKDNKLKWITNKIYSLVEHPLKREIENYNIKLLAVSRLTPPKRIDLLIEATRNLNNIELHIIGDGPLRSTLEVIIHENVIFHGEIDAFNDFSSYDIFALISDSEGLPLSALEAMSVGLPIILSDVGGCSELIEENGVLVKNDVNEIKKAIETCILNRDKFAIQSKKLFNKNFNLKVSKDIYLDYYKEILES